MNTLILLSTFIEDCIPGLFMAGAILSLVGIYESLKKTREQPKPETKDNAKTNDHQVTAKKCPNCGAPLDGNKCSYCKTVYN